MRGSYAELLLLLGLLLCTATTICFALNLHNSEVIRCRGEERQALLKLKQGLQDYDHQLSSWGSHEEDCCNWEGIKCSNRTGHVVTLHLLGKCESPWPMSVSGLSGEINPSLLVLQHLTYLDLSCNNFSIFPDFIGSLPKLQYLNLSCNSFVGTIPQQFGNLSSLISLDLNWSSGLIEDHHLDWLFHLPYLTHLDFSTTNLSKVVNWQYKVSALPSLKELLLSGCELISLPISHVLHNASSSPLSIIDLSINNLNSSIFPWLFKHANSLADLRLFANKLAGSIPKAFGNMVALVHVKLFLNNLGGVMSRTLENLHNLQVLDLSNNNISGEVLDLTNFSFFRELRLSKNRLNGSLTQSVAKLSMPQVLDVSSNSLEGDVTEAHLSNLSSLNQLDLSYNSLSLKFSSNWVPPFHLDIIRLSSCKLGSTFPQWLQTQKNFSELDMSSVGISDTIPNWFWNLSSNIKLLNLSHNHIKGTVPLQWFSSSFFDPHATDLSYNSFSGPLPQLNSDC